jgi:hypothetical protein
VGGESYAVAVRKLLWIVLVLVVGGCAMGDIDPFGPDIVAVLSRDNVIGVWRVMGGPVTATVTFTADGMVKAHDLPAVFFPAGVVPAASPDLGGTWMLTPASEEPHGPLSEVQITFDTAGGATIPPQLVSVDSQCNGKLVGLVYDSGVLQKAGLSCRLHGRKPVTVRQD